jgi:hypothetical protein
MTLRKVQLFFQLYLNLELVGSKLNVGPELLNALSKEKSPVVKHPGFTYKPNPNP